MISLKELNKHNYTTTPEIDANLQKLLTAINIVRANYSKPMIVTSGLRSIKDQKRINPKAMKSNHLTGCAVDIHDPKKELQEWCKANVSILEHAGLWCEAFEATPTWCHFQCVSPRSGNRFFKP